MVRMVLGPADCVDCAEGEDCADGQEQQPETNADDATEGYRWLGCF